MLLTQEDRLNKDLHLQMLFPAAKGIPPRRTRGRKARSLKMGSCALQKVTASNYFFDVFCRTLILKSLNKGGVRPIYVGATMCRYLVTWFLTTAAST